MRSSAQVVRRPGAEALKSSSTRPLNWHVDLWDASAPRRLSAAAPQRLSVSAPQRLNVPAPERLSASAPQRLSASAPQRLGAPGLGASMPQRLRLQHIEAPAPQASAPLALSLSRNHDGTKCITSPAHQPASASGASALQAPQGMAPEASQAPSAPQRLSASAPQRPSAPPVCRNGPEGRDSPHLSAEMAQRA